MATAMVYIYIYLSPTKKMKCSVQDLFPLKRHTCLHYGYFGQEEQKQS